MFGNLGNFAQLVKQASAMKAHMARMQEELARRTFEGDAGAGLVRATVNGRGELLTIKIDPQATADVELLEDLVQGAVAAASRKAQDQMRADLAQITGGLNIPGLEDMMGK
jgi:DNA-binding YbaB/EbfC family protein